MAEIRAVLFDLGNVLVRQGDLWPRAEQVFGAGGDPGFRELAQRELRVACRGEGGLSDAWLRVASQLGRSIADDTLRALWVEDYPASVSLDPAVLGLVRRLRSRHALGIVSDTVEPHAQVLRKLGAFDGFDPVVLSHEVGCCKDAPEIFRVAIERLGVAADHTLFVDDLASNVEMARSAGLRGVVYRSPDSLEQELRALGVLA